MTCRYSGYALGAVLGIDSERFLKNADLTFDLIVSNWLVRSREQVHEDNMKTLLAVLCSVGLVAGVYCLFVGGPAGELLSGALTCGIAYAILDRLDRIAEGAAKQDAIRQLLVEIRDRMKPTEPLLASPVTATEQFDLSKAVEQMEAARRVTKIS